MLKELLWLPVKSQVYPRDAVLTLKYMTGSTPTYLSSKFLTRGEVTVACLEAHNFYKSPYLKRDPDKGHSITV